MKVFQLSSLTNLSWFRIDLILEILKALPHEPGPSLFAFLYTFPGKTQQIVNLYILDLY